MKPRKNMMREISDKIRKQPKKKKKISKQNESESQYDFMNKR
jgi:hypothetical protein